MKQLRRSQRILILSLLSVSVFAPIIFVSHRLQSLTSIGRKEFIEDLWSIKHREHRADSIKLNSLEQEKSDGLEEPKQVVFEDKEFVSGVNFGSENNDTNEFINGWYTDKLPEGNVTRTNNDTKEASLIWEREISIVGGEKKNSNQKGPIDKDAHHQSEKKTENKIKYMRRERPDQNVARNKHNLRSQSHKITNEKVEEMKDQLIRARAYLNFAPPGSNSHLVKELKLRIKEVERGVGEATKDSDLSRSALQKMRSMEVSLSKASRVYPDCFAMASKLRAMSHNAEAQVQSQRDQVTYLVHLASRTTPKGLHCLSMRLTTEYFALKPEERKLLGEEMFNNQELHHYAVFSDNVLACAAVVNSTVSAAKEPEKIVFHVITNSVNFPAISMWFLLNPLGKVAIDIQSIDTFDWLPKYKTMKMQNSSDPRYISEMNHLRFHLPDVFPTLNKIVLFDHDVVVQQDLSVLWNTDMKGKVTGAVESCHRNESLFHRLGAFFNFSDPFVQRTFDANACTWAFGMNLFDLQEWRRQNLTALYSKYLKMGLESPMWQAGSSPLGWATFYNNMIPLDRRWHVFGLGYENPGVKPDEVQQAAVIHYDGGRKPWLDIAVGRYKAYWSKFINYDHPYLQQCNLHE